MDTKKAQEYLAHGHTLEETALATQTSLGDLKLVALTPLFQAEVTRLKALYSKEEKEEELEGEIGERKARFRQGLLSLITDLPKNLQDLYNEASPRVKMDIAKFATAQVFGDKEGASEGVVLIGEEAAQLLREGIEIHIKAVTVVEDVEIAKVGPTA